MAEQVPVVEVQLSLAHPAQRRFEFRPHLWRLRLARNNVSARNVEIVSECQCDRLAGEGLLLGAVACHDSGNRCSGAGRQYLDVVANADRSRGDTAHVASKIMKLRRGWRPADQLHWKTKMELVLLIVDL